ncbi:hypothetical protein J6590_018694 [Homalodisca vitripennis]|nr:hypothetical protein J6590_018694 [Homalodisca vitripennis]
MESANERVWRAASGEVISDNTPVIVIRRCSRCCAGRGGGVQYLQYKGPAYITLPSLASLTLLDEIHLRTAEPAYFGKGDARRRTKTSRAEEDQIKLFTIYSCLAGDGYSEDRVVSMEERTQNGRQTGTVLRKANTPVAAIGARRTLHDLRSAATFATRYVRRARRTCSAVYPRQCCRVCAFCDLLRMCFVA